MQATDNNADLLLRPDLVDQPAMFELLGSLHGMVHSIMQQQHRLAEKIDAVSDEVRCNGTAGYPLYPLLCPLPRSLSDLSPQFLPLQVQRMKRSDL